MIICVQSVPRNRTLTDDLKVFDLWISLRSQSSTFVHVYASWNKNHKIIFKVVGLFCSVNVTGDIENFFQIYILINKTKIVEIGTKLIINFNIESKKKPTTLGKQVQWYFMNTNTKTLLLKLGSRINTVNCFTNKDFVQIVLLMS